MIWRDTQVFRVLTESSAKGIYCFNRIRKDGQWKGKLKPETEWRQVACEPIISDTLWNEVNQIIEEQLKSWKRPGKLPVQMFGNLAQCACGHKMYVRAKSSKYVCRNCHNKIPIVDLEGIGDGEIDITFSYLPSSEDLCKTQQQLRGPG